MKGIADPKTRVVTMTIHRVVVIMTPLLPSFLSSFNTRAKAMVPLTRPDRNRYCSSLKLRGIFLPKKNYPQRRGKRIDTYLARNTMKS
jgi:hypothetical protein